MRIDLKRAFILSIAIKQVLEEEAKPDGNYRKANDILFKNNRNVCSCRR